MVLVVVQLAAPEKVEVGRRRLLLRATADLPTELPFILFFGRLPVVAVECVSSVLTDKGGRSLQPARCLLYLLVPVYVCTVFCSVATVQ